MEVCTFSGQLVQRLRDEGKVLDVVSEKVAESNELANLAKIVRRWHVSEQLKFFATWPDAFGSQNEPKVGHLGVSEEAFCQIDLELVLFQFGEDLIEDLQVMFVSGGMNDDIVDVDNDVVDAIEYFFHKPLERGWTA